MDKKIADFKRKAIEDNLFADDDRPNINAALVLIASSVVGVNIPKIAKATDLPIYTINLIARRLKENGIWVGDEIHHSGWDHEEEGGIAFLLDVACGSGMLTRNQTTGED